MTSRRKPKPAPEDIAEDPIAKQLALIAMAAANLEKRLAAIEEKLAKPSWWEWLSK